VAVRWKWCSRFHFPLRTTTRLRRPIQKFLAGIVYTAVEIQKAMMNNSLSAAQSWISCDKFKRENANSVIIQIIYYTKYEWWLSGAPAVWHFLIDPSNPSGVLPITEKIKNKNTNSIPVYMDNIIHYNEWWLMSSINCDCGARRLTLILLSSPHVTGPETKGK